PEAFEQRTAVVVRLAGPLKQLVPCGGMRLVVVEETGGGRHLVPAESTPHRLGFLQEHGTPEANELRCRTVYWDSNSYASLCRRPRLSVNKSRSVTTLEVAMSCRRNRCLAHSLPECTLSRQHVHASWLQFARMRWTCVSVAGGRQQDVRFSRSGNG